jgi:hypothetical protein
MLEYVTGEEQDWLGNTAPENGAMIVGARYSLYVGPAHNNESIGEYEFAWEFGPTKFPDEIRWVTTSDEPVWLRAVGYRGVPIPMTVKARARLLEHAVHQCAVAASVQLQREAQRSKKRFDMAWPTRDSWPVEEWDGYSPADRSFQALMQNRERAEWCAAAALFLADADRIEDEWG